MFGRALNARAWSLFAALSVIWGVPYLLIKIADDGGVPPFVLAWGRMVLAAAILLALAARAGSLRGLRPAWRWLVAYAVMELAIPLPLIATGEKHVSSSLAAIIIATVPLIVALLAFWFEPAERVRGRRLIGLVIGLVGVALLVGLQAAGSVGSLLAAGGLLIAATGYAIGPMIVSRHLGAFDPRAAMGTTLALASILLTPLAVLDWPARAPTTGAIAAVGALGVFCTALAFVLVALLIREIGVSRAVLITYINPVVALLLGIALLGEHPGPGSFAGLVLILAGCWLSTRSGGDAAALQAPRSVGATEEDPEPAVSY
jgi:drug/metabolite transporter (DMT)-like permease